MSKEEIVKGGAKCQAQEVGREQECNPKEWMATKRQRVQDWEAELGKIPGCKLVQIVGDFKMLSAVKWVRKEGTIINTRKITGLRIMKSAM